MDKGGHKSAVLWFTGLAGAGNSTLAHAVEERLYALGCRTYVLDGDNVRHGLCGDLGADRERVRGLMMHGDFLEIYCRCSLEVCEERDVKGLYKKARSGEVKEFTGISSPYEEPVASELVVDTGILTLEKSVEAVLGLLWERNVLKSVVEPPMNADNIKNKLKPPMNADERR